MQKKSWKSFPASFDCLGSGISGPARISPVLPLACLGVLLGYQPFAGSIARFSSAGELFHTYEPLVANLYAVRFDPVIDIWFLRLFWPAIWCALILLAGAFVLRWNRHKELGEQ